MVAQRPNLRRQTSNHLTARRLRSQRTDSPWRTSSLRQGYGWQADFRSPASVLWPLRGSVFHAKQGLDLFQRLLPGLVVGLGFFGVAVNDVSLQFFRFLYHQVEDLDGVVHELGV